MINRILERFYNIDPQEMMTEEQRNVLNYCTEIVQEVAKEYGKDTNVPSNGWIPCSEILPEAHKNVLVCENEGEIHLCRYNANMKRFFYDGSDWDIKLSEVIAWQPLPAPYQKGE